MPSNPLNYLRDLQIALVVNRVNLDAGALLALLVRYLPHISVNLVDGQAGPRF